MFKKNKCCLCLVVENLGFFFIYLPQNLSKQIDDDDDYDDDVLWFNVHLKAG